MKREIATRVVLLTVSFGAAYALTWALPGRRGAAFSAAQHGKREQLAPPRRSFSKLGFTICDYRGVDKIPADIVARTPYHDATALDGYLKKNQAGFEALRRELNPLILQATADAHRCFKDRGFGDGPKARVEWHVTSEAGFARASDFQINQLEGGDPETRTAALSCFESVLGKRTLVATKTKENGAFVQYDGLYPGYLPIFFAPNVDARTGAPLAAH